MTIYPTGIPLPTDARERASTAPVGTLRVLVVEDDPMDARLILGLLAGGDAPPQVEHAECLAEARARLETTAFDAVLLDLFLPDARALEGLDALRRACPDLPVVVLTARDDEHVAVEAVRGGAQEYLCKGRIDPEILHRSLRHAVERQRLLARVEVELARREAAEEALRRREAHYRALIENASDVIAVVEPDGTLGYVSPSVYEVLGYAPEALVGENALGLVHPADRAAVTRALRRRGRRPGTAVALEYRARHRDGGCRILHSIGSREVGGEDGGGLVVYSRDTTERRSAELDRERALSLLGATLEATADGILVADASGAVTGHNRQFGRMWGLSERAPGTGILDHILSQLRDPAAFRARVADPEGTEGEGFDVLQLHDDRTFECYSRPQEMEGITVGRVWSFRDVTTRRRLEARLLDAQKLEAVGQLAGGIAHDFNNLLTTVKGRTTLLLDEAPPELRPDLEEIRDAAERASGLTRQLQAFSRRQLLHPRVLDPNEVVSRLEPVLRRLMGREIAVECRLSPGAGEVRVDPSRLEQVLLNLALNARDAMPDGGTLTLRTGPLAAGDPRLEGTVPFPEGAVEVEVRDTGTGMDGATLARIFEPFFTTRPHGRGAGLGLSSAHGILRQSGGEIRVASEPGAGSVFTLLLPRAVPSRPGETGGAENEAGRRGAPTVLLVEDAAAVRRLAQTILERGGYRVLPAADGEEALRLAGTHPGTIDLLLTDVLMPGLPGPEMAARFLRERPGTPVVFMSGYAEEAPGIDAIGIDAPLLHKPFEPQRLLRLVGARIVRG